MDFKLTDEQELLLESIRTLINRDFPNEYFQHCDENNEYPIKFMNALAEAGIATVGIPEELGGVPGDVLTQMLVIEELSHCGAPGYLLMAPHSVHNMMNFGSTDQLKMTVESAMKGIPGYSLGFTEPQAGSDNSKLATTYTRKNGKVYINGQKTFISGALDYPYMLVMARDPEAKDPRRCFTMWWVDPKSPGVKINRLYKIGWHMISNCEVFFDNVEVEESALVGKEGYGFIQLMENFEIERVTVGAYSLGQAEAAFDDAVRYANQRVQFGEKIGNFQMIQEKITDMAIKIANMKNYVYQTAWEADNGRPLRITSALCKRYCAKAAMEVVDDALQIMGGLGYVVDSRVSRLWRDARVSRIGGGTDEIMVYIAGRQILKQYQ